MLKLEQVTKIYGATFKAVDNIDLTVEPGEIFGFLGPNGAGKTTTIRLISGILRANSGRITIDGHDIEREPIKAKQLFGYVPDDPNVFPRLKAIEYLEFLSDIYQIESKKRVARIADLSERFGLSDVLTDRIQSFSHGMRQKLVIIGALLHRPPLWILDEPMTGLDPSSSFILKEMMREQADDGKTVFFSTHILDVAEKICDRVAVIDQGKILFCGSIAQMHRQSKQDESLETMFLNLVDNNKRAGDQG